MSCSRTVHKNWGDKDAFENRVRLKSLGGQLLNKTNPLTRLSIAHLLDGVVRCQVTAAVLDAHGDLLGRLCGQEAEPDALPVPVVLLHAQGQKPATKAKESPVLTIHEITLVSVRVRDRSLLPK
jgi:hypothetical protein